MSWNVIIYIFVGILILAFALLFIAVIRTLLIKPTCATSVTIDYQNDDRAKTYGKILAKMIQCETISNRYDKDKTKFYRFQEILEKEFPMVHNNCDKKVFDGSLLYLWKGKNSTDPILLMSHHDVVEANGEWKHEPFSGDIEDGVIWGRGTVDTKSSLFCIFQAVEELIKEGYMPEQDIYIASSCTEEYSGEGAPLTVAYLKEQGVKISLLIDEGGMIIEEPIAGAKGIYAMVGVLEKGYGDLKFTAKGKGGHASAPGRHTPFARLAEFICEVEHHNPFKVKFNNVVKEMFRRLSPNMGFGMKLVFSNLWLFEPLLRKYMRNISPAGAALLQTTIAFTTSKGSEGLNVLPMEAYVTANLRFIPHQGTEESIALISKIAKKYDIETETIYKDKPCPIVDIHGEAYKKVETVIEKIFPEVGIIPYVMTGGTDAKYYSEVCDNCIRFAPLYITKQQLKSIHSNDENINIAVLTKGVDFYKEIIKKA